MILILSAGVAVIIHARRVILSAGALGSPAILLRSKVPNDQIGRGDLDHALGTEGSEWPRTNENWLRWNSTPQ